MSKPWEEIDDLAMQMIIAELKKLHKEYKLAQKKTLRWLLASFVPLLATLYIFYTEILYNLSNVFQAVMANKSFLLALFLYLALAAKVNVSKANEKEAKKDYKDVKSQVTDNLNTIWRFDYDKSFCNEIVRELNKDKINISFKG